MRERKVYPNDVTNAEWSVLETVLPRAKTTGRPRNHPLREMVNAMFYLVRSLLQGRCLPESYPCRQTVCSVVEYPAPVQDRDGAWDVFEAMAGHFPPLSLVWADQGYTGDLENLCRFAYGWRLEIVRRLPQKGFSLLPRRRVVELNFA